MLAPWWGAAVADRELQTTRMTMTAVFARLDAVIDRVHLAELNVGGRLMIIVSS
jgi:hypothetical protein